MKDTVFIFLLTILLALISCDGEPKKLYTYYENGLIKEEVEINQDSIADGIFKTYYQDGALKEVSAMKDGFYNGESIAYYESGKMKSKFNFVDNIRQGDFLVFYRNGNVQFFGTQLDNFPHGKHLEFYELDSGIVKYERYYITVKDEVLPTKIIHYDEEGNLIEASSYVKVMGLKDTINYQDTLQLELELRNYTGDFIHFFVGNFENPTDTLKATNGIINVSLKAEKHGINHLRGFVLDEKVIRREEGQIYTEGYARYFEFPYFVKH